HQPSAQRRPGNGSGHPRGQRIPGGLGRMAGRRHGPAEDARRRRSMTVRSKSRGLPGQCCCGTNRSGQFHGLEVHMSRAHRSLLAILAVIGLIAMAASADAQGKGKGKGKGKHNHLSGQQLLGDKIKTNGNHVIHKNGKYTASASVKDGKVTGVNVKHSEKGDVPVKKYKTNKKMAGLAGESSGI